MIRLEHVRLVSLQRFSPLSGLKRILWTPLIDVGVITKADAVTSSKSDVLSIVLGTSRRLRDWAPKNGWWPFRGRLETEVGLSEGSYEALVNRLFCEAPWVSIQTRAERKFGVTQLRHQLQTQYERLVTRK